MNSTVRLFLTRHGRTAWNHEGRFQGHTDVPLDDVGRAQASALAEALRGRVEAVITSDLTRALETARIVASALAIPILAVSEDLRERGYGAFEGLTRAECIARHPQAWAARAGNRNFEPPGSEPHALVLERMQRVLVGSVELLRERYRSGLVVGHGSSLRMFLEAISGAPVGLIGNLEFREVVHDGARFHYPVEPAGAGPVTSA